MFLAIPVEHKPSLQSPPWMTIALILVNLLIYFGWQAGEEAAVRKAAYAYADTALPALELPRLVTYLKYQGVQNPETYSEELIEQVEKDVEEKEYADLYVFMWEERQFRHDLLAGLVIGPGDEDYAAWRRAREAFSAREPRAFTTHWAQDYSLQSVAEVLQRPITLLTSTFLHGGFGHLLGNMVFLFIFGFTLEKTLGPGLYLGAYLLAGLGASAIAAWAYAGNGGYGLGASGAISGLMGMYAVLYRLQRIRFFYYIFFYFSYARLPALVMLPVWMAYELVQSAVSDSQVAYMAHFGGLLSGALLMAGLGMLRPLPVAAGQGAGGAAGAAFARRGSAVGRSGQSVRMGQSGRKRGQASHAGGREHERGQDAYGHSHDHERADAFAALVVRARAQADALDFRAASKTWRAAARQRPRDMGVLQAWFDVARHWPESEDFHAAAHMLFQLRARDESAQQVQLQAYKTYLAQARPFMRLRPVHMLQLARACVALGDLDEADRLCRLLLGQASERPEVPVLLSRLSNAWAKAGRLDQALAWLPALQRLAPRDPMTVWLAAQAGRAGRPGQAVPMTRPPATPHLPPPLPPVQ
ncbi:MAG: rhomboid family intramembrane serine protease [Brachymonas sp.]|nr:rhomboid family intramembrane serine protease [Brachymonas sp.]